MRAYLFQCYNIHMSILENNFIQTKSVNKDIDHTN